MQPMATLTFIELLQAHQSSQRHHRWHRYLQQASVALTLFAHHLGMAGGERQSSSRAVCGPYSFGQDRPTLSKSPMRVCFWCKVSDFIPLKGTKGRIVSTASPDGQESGATGAAGAGMGMGKPGRLGALGKIVTRQASRAKRGCKTALAALQYGLFGGLIQAVPQRQTARPRNTLAASHLQKRRQAGPIVPFPLQKAKPAARPPPPPGKHEKRDSRGGIPVISIQRISD